MLFLYGLLLGAFLSGLLMVVVVLVDEALQARKVKRSFDE